MSLLIVGMKTEKGSLAPGSKFGMSAVPEITLALRVVSFTAHSMMPLDIDIELILPTVPDTWYPLSLNTVLIFET